MYHGICFLDVLAAVVRRPFIVSAVGDGSDEAKEHGLVLLCARADWGAGCLFRTLKGATCGKFLEGYKKESSSTEWSLRIKPVYINLTNPYHRHFFPFAGRGFRVGRRL